jgi:glycosyltransferase involved in cell wall biosynthesis
MESNPCEKGLRYSETRRIDLTGFSTLGMILKGYPRISETFISNEILLLESLGFKIHIFSMRQPRESFCHDSVKKIKAKVDYLPETLLKPLPKFLYHNIQLAIKNPRLYSKAFRKAIIRFKRTKKSATLKHLFQAGYLVNKFLPVTGIKHFHAHFAHSPTSVAMFASCLSGIPFSFTAHAKDIYTSDYRQLREKIGLAKFVVTCTEYNRNHLKQTALGEQLAVATPVHRIYHGIDMNLFSDNAGTNRKIKKPAPPFQLMTVARLTSKKGLPTVYKALHILKRKGLLFHHTLIGDGDERDKILFLIKSLGLENVSQWLGTRPHQTVLEQYQKADLFVLGSEIAENGDRDGIPNVFVESMAMGVPVVGTNVSAIPELIKHEETGLLVSPGNPEALADAILRLLEDESLRNRIIAAARKKVASCFNNRILIQELADVLNKYVFYKSSGFFTSNMVSTLRRGSMGVKLS